MSKPDRAYLSRRAQREVIESIEENSPSRAIAVLRFIDRVDSPSAPKLNYKQRREQERRTRKQGHPGRTTSRQRRRQWHDTPDEREMKIREMNRLIRLNLTKAREEDGEVAGLLMALSEFVVDQHLQDFSLPEEHRWPWTHWLMAKFGDVLREPDPEGYLAWREQSLRDLEAAK